MSAGDINGDGYPTSSSVRRGMARAAKGRATFIQV
jgi:hypothetical protein